MTDDLQGVRVVAALSGIELFGHERGNIEVFRTLRERGAEVWVGVTAGPERNLVAEHLREDGFRTFPIPFGNQWSWTFLRRHPTTLVAKTREVLACSHALHRALRESKATHVHLGSSLAYAYLAPALARHRLPLVYRMGDAPPVGSGFNLRVWRSAMRRTTTLACNSAFVLGQARAQGARDGVVIYNFARRMAAAGDAARRLREREPDAPVRVVYVGSIAEHKGLLQLVQAIAEVRAEHPRVVLDIVGGSRYDGQFRGRLEGLVTTLGLAGHVRFAGFVEDPARFYQEASLHVAPSVWEEPSGGVVLEAKSLGTPSVVFPSGGLPEMVRHGEDGYVCEDKTAEALAKALRWMLADGGRLHRMGEAALADSATRFGRDRFGAAWSAVYRGAWPGDRPSGTPRR
jgi:glycosyltransferase involved in cell wall biosynthesis